MSDQNQGFLHTLFLKKWHPVPTVTSTVILFTVFGLFLLVLGIIITIINSNIQEIIIPKYDTHCISYNEECTFKYDLVETMQPPIFIYYELENFYQNHRRYVKSKSSTQLSGEPISDSDAQKYCDPVVYNKDLHQWQFSNHINIESQKQDNNLDPNSIASPCGLIAKSFFNDTFAIKGASTLVTIDETGISWPNDKGKKFKAASDTTQNQWINPENEHFIVWMRTAGLSNFRKLWGRISEELQSGTYTFTIQNNYNPSTFAGAKNIIISTSGPFGGKNVFLGVAFIVVGIICLLIAIAFIIKKKISGDLFGEKKER